MPRSAFLLDVVTPEPTSTSELYTRVGYLKLAQHGLIPYAAFRDALVGLRTAGLLHSQTGEDGATLWQLSRSDGGPTAADLGD